MLAVAFLAMVSVAIDIADHLSGNYQKVLVIKAFFSLNLTDIRYSNALQDGIPDNWSVEAWGGAREKFDIINFDSYSGNRAAMIEHTNQSGAATLTQQFSVLPQSSLIASVYTKGETGAIRIQFWDESNKIWTGGAIKEIKPSPQWYQTAMELSTPAETRQARILLYSDEGLILFDDAYVGFISNNQSGDNLLTNADFEEDGVLEDPLIWWQNHVSYGKLNRRSLQLDKPSLTYSNLIDLINLNFSGIKTRARAMGRDCVLHPGMTSYLLSWGKEFNLLGGAAAEERLYQFAITLAPNCPRPYAALAKLYKEHKSYQKASTLFSKASELSAGTPLEGKYAFEAGLIDWTYTGALDSAITNLQKAAAMEGWQPSPWYKGAALFYLARSLEEIGNIGGAIQAYQRLLDCDSCIDHQMDARNRLDQIISEQEDN